jgi:glycosyltransferase involved in cell wall biosynthesis
VKTVAFISFNAYKLFFPDSGAAIGGSEVQVFLLAKWLALQPAMQASVVVGNFGQAAKVNKEGVRLIRSIRLDKSMQNYVTGPFLFWKSLWITKADMFIASPAGPEIGLLGLYCRLLGKKFIFRVGSDIDCTSERPRQLGWVAGWLYKIGVRLADVIVVQHRQQLLDLQTIYQRTGVIIPSVIMSTIRPATLPRTTILWVGSARPVKLPELFIRLAIALPQFSFVMIMSSSGDAALLKKIQNEVQNVQNLQFLVDVPYEKIPDYLMQTKLLVGTSDYEGWPNVYLQAAAYGVPVVSYKVDPDQYLTTYHVGMVAGGSEDAFVMAVKDMMEAESTWQTMSTNAVAYAQKHDIATIGPAWLNILRQFI